MMKLIQEMLQGDFYSLSRLITMVENDSVKLPEIMREIHSCSSDSYHIGITGPPGAGKSTLTGRLTSRLRAQGATVGIIACDPTSPLTGGALLGDRIRLESLFLDDGVFIRSMATRGKIGGLSRKIHAIARLLRSFGRDFIIIETVGVGQTEVDVSEIADTTILVLTPIVGDYIQAMKAGIMEIADIFVINKMDLGEANVIAEEIASVLAVRKKEGNWKPPIIKTQSIEGTGIEELYEAIKVHRLFMSKKGLDSKRRKQSRRQEFREIMKERVLERLGTSLGENEYFMAYLHKVESDEMNPYQACDEILADKKVWESLLYKLFNNYKQ